MANPDWYPSRLGDRSPWHTNFNTQAVATGVSRGLSAAQVTQITADLGALTVIINALVAADDYAQALTAFKDAFLDGPIGVIAPSLPAPPASITWPVGAIASIQARTRQYAALIKAQPTYTHSIGELYGIEPPAAGPLADPSVRTAMPTAGTSNVVLNLTKGGYDVIAVEMRRNGGAWNQIGVSQTATFTDTTALLVAGQPEQRDYRVQGMLNNARAGGLSATVSAVTVP